MLSHNQKTCKCFELIALGGFTAVLLVAFAGCGAMHNAQIYEMGKIQFGVASWYADKFQGRETSSGEKYDKDAFTAAHRILPFGTIVKVTNIKNGRNAFVRINDRGPQKASRKLDLSYAAAKKIGMINDGIARVRLEIVDGEVGKMLYEQQFQQMETANAIELNEFSEFYGIRGSIPIAQVIGSTKNKIATLKLNKIPFGIDEYIDETPVLVAIGSSTAK